MQQITRGDYLKDLITIYVDNNLQTSLTDLYESFIFQCGDIQQFLTPAQVIKISLNEQESQLLKNTNIAYLAGITKDGHKETFNGSLSFNTRGEVVYYEPPVSTVISATTATDCNCHGINGFFSNCSQPAIKAYFSLNYVPTKLSELQNDTDFQDSVDVAESISIHNTSTEAHPYIQDLIATEASLRNSQTEALSVSIGAETTAREEAVSLAISTTEGYTDASVSVHNSNTEAHPYIQSALSSATEAIQVQIGDLENLDTSVKSSIVNAINSEVSARESADNNLQGQIDGLAAASDVTDIVGTYQELQNYDTQHLQDNDIIKVLTDSTHDNQPSYYRFDKDTDTFSYIGSESAAYTKAQSDSIFVTQTTEINGHALSSDINLTPSDIGALADTYATVISANTSAIAANTTAIASNTSVIAQHTTAIASNTSDISTINGKIPTDASSSNKLVSASTLAASIADFANQDLFNLTNNGENRLHALKSYSDNGELLTDTEGLADVKSYAHSTFDRSKFTVVGSPNITNDGIASGFSSSNYLTGNNFTFNDLKDKSWKVTMQAQYNSDVTTTSDDHVMLALTNNYLSNGGGISLSRSKTIKFWIVAGDNNGTQLEAYTFTPSGNGTVTMELSFDVLTGTYTITFIDVNGSSTSLPFTPTTQNKQLYSIYLNPTSTFKIGNGSDGYSLLPIDLKYFSITVDGVPIFSGNHTGIDTIKPDDYTVVGTPTISADGIASGLDWQNYISTTSIDFSKKVVIKGVFKFNNKTFSGGKYLLEIGNIGGLNFNSNFMSTSLSGAYSNTVSSSVYVINEPIEVEWVIDGISSVCTLKQQNNTIATLTSTLSTALSSSYTVTIGGDSDASDKDKMLADLNAFKIYVNGNLVCQPCLKIPYTESKTGSKIVDNIYRDRVNDMAEQFGYANYYTLDEDNGNFTLPQVELYGLIGQRTLRDSYRNGATYWELWSDRTLEVGGTCTSGVEYNLPRSFTSATDYILSVPYSAKTASSFTPTVSGDFIAKGLGVL